LAPLRGYNLYEDADPYNWVPGAQPRVRTFTDEQDLVALQTSIVAAHREADIVMTSFDWGDWTRPAHLTDHEIRVAHCAIDFGADIVVGHHHHLLRGIEWYRRPCSPNCPQANRTTTTASPPVRAGPSFRSIPTRA